MKLWYLIVVFISNGYKWVIENELDLCESNLDIYISICIKFDIIFEK